jgi:hypothetical protein
MYTYAHAWISSIQKGIQSWHCSDDMSIKYEDQPEKMIQLNDWKRNHKTVMIMNGGNSAMLEGLHEFFNNIDNPYAFGWFHEDAESLNGAITSVGICLPEKIYNAMAFIRKRNGALTYQTVTVDNNNRQRQLLLTSRDGCEILSSSVFTQYEKDLIEKLATYSLA